MQIIPSYIRNWFYPPEHTDEEEVVALTQAKFKEVMHLASEQVQLSSRYYPFTVEHPTKLSQKASELVHYFSQTSFGRNFESSHNLSLRQFQSLDEKSKVKTLLHHPIASKNLLEHINSQLNKASPSFVCPIPSSNPFYDTDLVMYENSYQGTLPVNGIYQKDLNKIAVLYNQIAEGKTPITINGSFGFQLYVLTAFKKLLTRAYGRELIYSILKPNWSQYLKNVVLRFPSKCLINIFPHNKRSFVECSQSTGNELIFSLSLCKEATYHVYIQKDEQTEKVTEKSPFYVSLAHELIHIRHALSNKSFKAIDKQEILHFSNEYEKVTITGMLNGKEEDPVSENSVRNQFNFFPRISHEGVTVDYYWV